MDVQARVVNYYKSNSFIKDFMKGIDAKTGEVILVYNGENRRISIDKLEKILSEGDLINYLEGNTPIMQEETKEVKAPETLNDSVVNNVGVSNNVVANNGVQKLVEEQKFTDQKTLNDIALLTELKSKDGLDNVLKEFAIKEETGLLDFNVALNKVVGNTIREVERSISSRTDFSSDLTKYDIQGNFIGELIQADSSPDEKIMKGFQNINVYLNASKMYPEQVNFDPQGIETFKNSYIAKVKSDLGLNAPVRAESAPKKQLVLENNEVKNAGFADVFVLTVIVLVYAAIIVNLIIKLK